MSNNISANCDDCDDDLGLPIGPAGAKGEPSILALSYTIGGAPFISTSTSYVEVGRFPFSNTIADPFEGIKNNVWVSGGTGKLRVRDLVSGTVIYENTNITSTSATNIETVTGQSVYDVANALVVIEVAHATGGANSISIGATTLYYTS